MGFIFDRTEDGRAVKVLSIVGEFTRKCIGLHVGRSITAANLTELFGVRSVSKLIRCDNGPEFVASVVCRLLERTGIMASWIEPGSPWQNGYVESFHSRFRDECLQCEWFCTSSEVRTIIERWLGDYNHRRPHSSLDNLTPAEFAPR